MPAKKGPEAPKMGRPSKYRPEFCEEVVAFMGEGYSLTAFAGKIGVCGDTVRQWQHDHPDFSVAVKKGQAARTMRLETTLIAGETGPKVTAHIFALKNAAPEEWRDRQNIEHTGKDGGPIQTEVTSARDILASKLDRLTAGKAASANDSEPDGSAG